MMETDLEFVRIFQRQYSQFGEKAISASVIERLLLLAETAALIVEHDMDLISPFKGCAKWTVYALMVYALEDARVEDESLHTAVRAVAAKIGRWQHELMTRAEQAESRAAANEKDALRWNAGKAFGYPIKTTSSTTAAAPVGWYMKSGSLIYNTADAAIDAAIEGEKK